MSEDHTQHDLVWQLSGDESTARQKCRRCSYRTDWDVPPAELTPWTEDELAGVRSGGATTFGGLTAEGGKG